MNHNKKRNTAFLYEVLLREGTRAALQKDLNKAKIVRDLIFQHFNPKCEMNKELELYRSLNDRSVEEEHAERYLREVERRYNNLNKTALFNEQSVLINKINKQLGTKVYNTFIPNYKDLATISQIFNPSTKVKEKILLEKVILDKIKIVNENKKENLQTIDTVLFKTFSKKFNERYGSLLTEQKELLNRYVSSFSDNLVEFKVYLNEEIGRLKENVLKSLESEEIKSDDSMKEKTKQTFDFLETFKNIKDINHDMLQKILKIQQFVHEVGK